VTPHCNRYKYDGTIISNTVYSTTRVLYRMDVRESIGGDLGFSSRLSGPVCGQKIGKETQPSTGKTLA